MPANPNHSKAARNQTKTVISTDVDEATEGVKALDVQPQSRRERESLEAAQAKERYRKLHEAGKTDEAKADLARLRVIREKREAEAARKQVRGAYEYIVARLLLTPSGRERRARSPGEGQEG